MHDPLIGGPLVRFVSSVWKYCIVPALALVVAASPRAAAAQGTGVIRGTVTDSTTQQPIAGAQLIVVGTRHGATTNDAGSYVIRGVEGSSVTVRAQRIGFAPQSHTVTIGAGATAATSDFVLRPVAAGLSQVVVVGYGSRSRADVSGAVSTVSGSDITNTPVAGIDAALQGKTPGVQVTQNAGNPGNGISVRIRGSASVSASNQPLYVVDGIPIQQEDFSQLGFNGQNVTVVTAINPEEVESITVLKDAASAAIYGSRASNGVILITTKRGQAGKTRITFDAYTGMQNVQKKLPMLTGKQYVAFMAKAAANDDYAPSDYGFVAGVDDSISTDWQNAVFRQAPVQNMNVGLSGGTNKMKYYVSGTYFNQTGIVIGSSYQRANGRANLDFNATDRLTISTSVGLARELTYRVQGDGSLTGIVTNAIGNQPEYPVRNADGTFTNTKTLQYPNSVALATYNSAPNTTLRTLANIEARYALLPSLTFTGRAGTDQLNMHERSYESPLVGGTYAASVNGVGKSGYSTGSRFLGEGFFTYDGKLTDRGNWSLTAGASTERDNDELNFVRGEGFSSPALHDAGSAASVTSYDASRSGHNLLSYFSRANFSLMDRYLLTASIRRDGSSRFGQANRYGTFPAISAGWVITNEPLFNALSRLGTIKLRASYGITGNQGISNYAFLPTYGASNYGTLPGIAPNNFGNPNLKWEQTKESDFGFDWSMFDGRITLIGDTYIRRTSNLLIARPITATSGFTTFWDNVGDVKNTGNELQLSTQNVRSGTPGGLSWTTDFSLSTNHNVVTKLYGNQPLYGGIRSVNSVRVGAPLGAFYLLQFTGVDPKTGNAVYKDVNGDGSVTAADRILAGNATPTYWGGFTNTFTWKNFDLKGFLQYSGGNKIFNAMRLFADDAGYSYDNKLDYVLRSWQKPGDITDEPRPSFDGLSGARTISTRLLESGSYTRLQEITLGYRMPDRFSNTAGLHNTRIYVSGHNLATFTGYRGYNPDVNSNGSGSSFGLGTDFYAYPLARTYSVGLSTEW